MCHDRNVCSVMTSLGCVGEDGGVRVQVLDSPAAAEITAKPYLVGEELLALAREASRGFVRHVAPAAVPVVLEILNGGRYYCLPDAVTDVCGYAPVVWSLRAKRSLDAESGSWRVRVWEQEGMSETAPGPLLIGDTIATGTTLAGVLEEVVAAMLATGQGRDVYVFTIAGAGAAVPKLAPVARLLRDAGHTLTLVYANGLLDLAADGTDLGMREAVLLPAAWARLQPLLSGFPVPCLKCAVWDWGDRFTQPEHHLTELAAHLRTLPPDTPGLGEMLAHTLTRHKPA